MAHIIKKNTLYISCSLYYEYIFFILEKKRGLVAVNNDIIEYHLFFKTNITL